MTILGIDTSTRRVGVVLADAGVVLARGELAPAAGQIGRAHV